MRDAVSADKGAIVRAHSLDVGAHKDHCPFTIDSLCQKQPQQNKSLAGWLTRIKERPASVAPAAAAAPAWQFSHGRHSGGAVIERETVCIRFQMTQWLIRPALAHYHNIHSLTLSLPWPLCVYAHNYTHPPLAARRRPPLLPYFVTSRRLSGSPAKWVSSSLRVLHYCEWVSEHRAGRSFVRSLLPSISQCFLDYILSKRSRVCGAPEAVTPRFHQLRGGLVCRNLQVLQWPRLTQWVPPRSTTITTSTRLWWKRSSTRRPL